jgi:hypothetical protein
MGFLSLTLAGIDMGVIGTVRLWDTTAQCPLGEVPKMDLHPSCQRRQKRRRVLTNATAKDALVTTSTAALEKTKASSVWITD